MKLPEPRRLPSGSWFIQLRLGGESIPVTEPSRTACVNSARLIKAEYLAGREVAKKKAPPAPEMTLRELLEKTGLKDRVALLREDWRPEDYRAVAAGLENEPEGGLRCTECFRLRLRETARAAARGGFDYFCSTLTLSRHKDAVRINGLGEQIAREEGVSWLPSDFKKQGREMRSTEMAEQLGLYRQLYCGCEYSLRRREEHGAD